MKSFDFDACAYDGEVYCNECLPEGVTTESESVMPVFADSEWDYYPSCSACHAEHDYVNLTSEGRARLLVSGCFCGLRGLEIEMTVEQAASASHQGKCDEDVAVLLKEPAIAAQLDAISPEAIRAALREYGVFDDGSPDRGTSDDEANRARAVWLAACDARENNGELFS